MGAATTLLYAHKDQRIKAICLDSPFADFRKLAKELALNNFNYPNFLIDTILNFLGKTVKKKNGFGVVNVLNVYLYFHYYHHFCIKIN